MDAIFTFGFVIAVFIVVLGVALNTVSPRLAAAYRRGLANVARAARRQVTRFARWAWRNYHQFIVGVGVGIVLTLYFLGRLPTG